MRLPARPSSSFRSTATCPTTPRTVRDLTGGLKCFRRSALERLDFESISSKGYAFQIETTYRTIRGGFRVVEVPIVFSERRAGGSKMSGTIVLEALWKVPLLRLRALTGSM
jgi:dolichol-phosphate mannosyltransferase